MTAKIIPFPTARARPARPLHVVPEHSADVLSSDDASAAIMRALRIQAKAREDARNAETLEERILVTVDAFADIDMLANQHNSEVIRDIAERLGASVQELMTPDMDEALP